MLENVEIIPTHGLSEGEWKKLRKIGGSSVSTLAGINPYSSPYQLWAEMTGRIEGFQGNEATDWGHILETPVAEMFAKTMQVPVLQWPVSMHSTKYPWASANLDGLVLSPEFGDGGITECLTADLSPYLPYVDSILEVKTSGIATPGKPYEWFKGKGSIPEGYQLQGQWYMGLTGFHKTTFVALVANHGLVIRELEFDEELFLDLVEISRDFWENHILADVPPEVDGKDSTEEALKQVFPRHMPDKVYEGGEWLAEQWAKLEELKVAEKQAIEDRKAVRNSIVQRLGDAEFGAVDNEVVCSFRASRDADSFEKEKFVREHPRLAKQYTKKRPGARQLRSASE